MGMTSCVAMDSSFLSRVSLYVFTHCCSFALDRTHSDSESQIPPVMHAWYLCRYFSYSFPHTLTRIFFLYAPLIVDVVLPLSLSVA